MSDQTSIFEENQNGGAASTTPEQQNQFNDLLNSVKNEQGQPKYKNVEEALKGLQNAQEFIPALKSENAQMKSELEQLRAEVLKLKTIEDTVSKLTAKPEPTQEQPPKSFGEQDIADIIDRTLSQKETQAIQKANLSKVTAVLLEKFGADAEKTFYGKAQEVGLSVEQVNQLASQSPQAVFKMLGIDGTPKQQFQNPTTSSTNTAGYTGNVQTYIGRNDKPLGMGATTEDFRIEADNAKKLVEELHSKGLSTYDLADPKAYFKHFKQGN